MFCKVYCACCNGIDAITVTVEVDITPGISFNLVGLPDVAVKESLQRISGALGHFGFKIPGKRILVNMAPANIKKEGSAFDLAIAVGILYASGQIIKKGDGTELYIERKLSGHLIMGELALDGTLRDFQGALAIAASANKMGFRSCIFPRRTAMECTEIDNVSIFWAENVEDVINILESPDRAQKHLCSKIPYKSPHEQDTLYENDFAYIRGQEIAKKGLEVAAAGGHKVLLFSQFTTMLDQLCKRLDQGKIPYYLLTGSVSKEKRQEMVKVFQEDNTPVFCISLKAGGTGLNLTAADIVIHYDPWWNTAVQDQATDRAHRIGQENVVNVYRLVAKGTIEENIIRLQDQKRQLADSILSGDGMSSGTFDKEELLELLG